MAKELSRCLTAIQPSVTLAIDAKAKEMRASGIDIIGLGAGEPDFDTPAHVVAAAIKAMQEGKTRYTPAAGTLELRQAICRKLKRDNGLTYEPADIVVSNGAKHSLFNAIHAVCNPGDEVLLPAPYWVSYYELIKMAGATPVLVTATEENGYLVTAQQLKDAITDKTKALILNSPCNPTGAVYPDGRLMEIAALAVEKDIYVISDEIYECLVYDGAVHTSIASFGPEIKDLTVVVNGLSKAYAMTGWRIGYTASNRRIATAMANFQSHATSNANSIAQAASIAALDGDKNEQRSMISEFSRRRQYMMARISAINGINAVNPRGAFYIFANISGLFGKSCDGHIINSAMDFSSLLLEKANVAVVPGEAFGDARCIRLAYATDMQSIMKAMDRIEGFVNSLT